MLKMTGTAILTFSHTLSFAFLHSTGSPGIVLGKGDNEDGKGKSNKGKGMDYSEQLFLNHSFCPLTHSVGRVGSECWVRSGCLSWVQSGCWVIGLGWVRSSGRVGSSPVGLLGQVVGLGRVVGLGCWVGSLGSSEGDGDHDVKGNVQLYMVYGI